MIWPAWAMIRSRRYTNKSRSRGQLQSFVNYTWTLVVASATTNFGLASNRTTFFSQINKENARFQKKAGIFYSIIIVLLKKLTLRSAPHSGLRSR